MDRAEKIGLGIALAGHVVLFGWLSLGFLKAPDLPKVQPVPVEVSLVQDVALEATAPPTVAPPAPSVAPDTGAPEDAAAPEPAETPPEPEPAPPKPPHPKPAPPEPEPVAKPVPVKPAPKPAPAPKPVPKPIPKPVVKPVAKPEPRAAEKPVATKAAPAKPAPAKPAPAKPAPAKSTPATATKPNPAAAAKARPSVAKGTGSSATATTARPRGSRLGNDFLKGLSDQPSTSTSEAPRAAKVDARAMASIGAAILRQVQPCADRNRTPGPGAERIRVTITLHLNRDGTLAARPTIGDHVGVDDENSRYVDRVDDLAIATFVGCSPLRGLPDDLYDVPNGWRRFSLRYKLPG